MKERKEKLVAVRLPLSLRSVLYAEAERRGLTISHVVREVLTLTLVEENHGTYSLKERRCGRSD